MTQEETGKLIESVEKNGKKSVEAPETASITDGPGQGNWTNTGRGLKRHCEHDDDAGRDWRANRK